MTLKSKNLLNIMKNKIIPQIDKHSLRLGLNIDFTYNYFFTLLFD